MKKELAVLDWNLNYASCDSVTPASFIEDYIKGYDLAVLTEVRANRKLIEIIQNLGYDYIVSDDQGKYTNQIIMLAKKEYRLEKRAGAIKEDNDPSGPDFLHGHIVVGEKAVNVIGVRVKTGCYPDRYMQVRLMKEYIASVEGPVICTGDFNSGQIRGSAEAAYSDVMSLYEYRKGGRELSDLRFYNFHLIKELLGNQYVFKETMGEDNSWGLYAEEGRLKYGGFGLRLKNDLLFYSNGIEGKSRYSWEHVRDNEQIYLDMLIKNRKRSGNKVTHGFPDHARLIADLKV